MITEKEILSKTFGKLRPIKECERGVLKSNHKVRIFLCKCDCGNVKKYILTSLMRKKRGTESCGCLVIEKNTKHGIFTGTTKNKIYNTYKAMISRCYDKNNKDYKNYGGRGISVCDRWRENILNFFEDMEESHSEDLTIDRIDNSKGYSKENCKWETRKNQNRSKRNIIPYEFEGRKMLLSDWAKEKNIKFSTLRSRIFTYKWSIEKALNV